MPQPTEHKSVQSRILEYAGDIGWSFVSQREAETRRGFTSTSLSNPTVVAATSPSNHEVVERLVLSEVEASRNHRHESAKNASRFFTEILFEKVIQFNPAFVKGLSEAEARNDLFRLLDMPLPNIQGNRDLLRYLQGEKTFFSKEENREFNLVLIDYENPANNIYEVTEEYYFFNGQYANQQFRNKNFLSNSDGILKKRGIVDAVCKLQVLIHYFRNTYLLSLISWFCPECLSRDSLI